jgi:bifunctional UDP-N-acetylglucosamine pyrophosphorylase/glucosamine-1-phosphate N-acetyltransferase
VEDEVEIGPFCHLSPGTHLATNVHLGNFVEVRDSYLSPGVKVEHFAFLSSATVGDTATSGAGAVVQNKVASGTVVVGMPVRPVSSLKGSD